MEFLRKHKAYIVTIYAFLLFINLVLKDRFYPISILFYACPLILIIGFGIFSSILYLKKKIIAFSLLSLQIILTVYWFNNYYAFAEEMPETKNTSSILLWNVAKKDLIPIDILVETIRKENITNLALVEAEHITDKDFKNLNKQLPKFHFKKLKGNMLFGSINRIKTVRYTSEDRSHKFNLIQTYNNNNVENILIVDIYANPFLNRKLPLETTFQYIKNTKTDIIVGDFNTPFESVHFKQYKEKFQSFHVLSNGATATWAFGLPLMELDHIWISSKYIPIHLKKKNFLVSDHQLLIASYLKN